MTTFWTVVLIVSVLVVLKALHRRRSNARRSSLADIAVRLGLEVTEFEPLGTPVSRSEVPIQDGTSSRNRARPLADAAKAVWGTRQVLRGQWNGRAVSIGDLPARRYRLAVAAQCRLPSQIGLWAQGDTVVLTPPEATTAVCSGDDVFDRQVRVAAKDTAAAAALLQRVPVRAAIVETIASHDTAHITGDRVCMTPYDHDVLDVERARRLLDEVTRVAAVIDKAL